MTRKVVTGFAAVLAAAVVLIPGAAAADLDARTVTLQATDMPGARITSQGTVKETGYPSAYHRTFSYKTPNGGAGVLLVEAESLVATDVAQATRDQAKVRKSLGTQAVRNQLIAGLASTLKVKKTAVKVGAMKTPQVGDHAFEMPVTITLKSGSRVYMSLFFMQLDRVVSQFTTLAIRPIALRDTVYATAVAAHVGTALTPAVSVAPSITGTPQQGQTLTAAPGTWSAADATFAYQWQKCDAAGANCADIPGQTAQTYAVQPTDVGATLRVNVTATNRFGTSTPAPSAATAVVT